jgi:uncharacterized lipoprotein YddW (UPF0748 family)
MWIMFDFCRSHLGIISLLTLSFTCQSVSRVTAETRFTDLEDHWAKACISELGNRRILNGYPDGTFRPNAPVTRAEFASLLITAFSENEPVRDPIQFIDIPTDFWANDAITGSYERGFLSGYSGKIFNPSQDIPKVQVLVALTAGLQYSANQLEPDLLNLALNDADDIPDYARSAIAAAIERQLLINYPNVREFNPNQPAIRAEVAAYFCQTLIGVYSPIPVQYIARADLDSEIADNTEDETTDITETPVADNTEDETTDITETPVADNTEDETTDITETPVADNTEDETTDITETPVADNTEDETTDITETPVADNTEDETTDIAEITPEQMANAEIRGVWLTNIDSEVLFSPGNLAEAIAHLADLNFNTVYPAVWNWGYTLYPSQVAQEAIGSKIDPDPGLRGRDILAEIIRHSREKNMRVIPWFEFGFMAPADSELARRHPEWITQRQDGTQVKMEGAHPRVWLNPFHPEVQDFLIDLIVEIVDRYDVDGIQLDDHMGLPSEFGYDEFTVALYKEEHNGQEPPSDPKDPDWIRWRADKITEFMEKLFRAVKARNENVIVALSPNPQNFSYREFLADWSTWEQKGFIEEVIVQVYRSDRNAFIAELQNESIQKARQHIPVGIGILAGLKGRPVSMADIEDQVNIVRQQGFAGVSFFFYQSLWTWAPTSAEERADSFNDIFSETVVAPNILEGWQPPSN